MLLFSLAGQSQSDSLLGAFPFLSSPHPSTELHQGFSSGIGSGCPSFVSIYRVKPCEKGQRYSPQTPGLLQLLQQPLNLTQMFHQEASSLSVTPRPFQSAVTWYQPQRPNEGLSSAPESPGRRARVLGGPTALSAHNFVTAPSFYFGGVAPVSGSRI